MTPAKKTLILGICFNVVGVLVLLVAMCIGNAEPLRLHGIAIGLGPLLILLGTGMVSQASGDIREDKMIKYRIRKQ